MSAAGHEHRRDDAAAYVLGALEGPEREAFVRHLEDCPECREDVERLRPAADALPRSVERLTPPPSLKAALMKKVREEARAAPARRRGGSLRERLAALSPARMRPGVAWVAAALLLAAGILTGVAVTQGLSGDEPRTIGARVDSSRLSQDAGGALLVTGDGESGAILRVHGLSSLRRDRVYQVWVERDGALLPQPTFEVGQDGRGAVAVPADLSDADAVLVTREPRGGARVPSEPGIMRVPL